MALSNASLLDESTAAAEAMSMCYNLKNQKKTKFFVSDACHPQNIALIQTRGSALGLTIDVGDVTKVDLSGKDYCGVLIQYPDTYGKAQSLSRRNIFKAFTRCVSRWSARLDWICAEGPFVRHHGGGLH